MSRSHLMLLPVEDVHLDRGSLATLLAPAVANPTPDRLEAVIRSYAGHATLLVALEGGLSVGVIGLRPRPDGATEIGHIAVADGHRRRGIGRHMVGEVVRRGSFVTLVAETDAEAVDFYRHCGFDVTSLGEKYPGVERFRCTLRPQR